MTTIRPIKVGDKFMYNHSLPQMSSTLEVTKVSHDSVTFNDKVYRKGEFSTSQVWDYIYVVLGNQSRYIRITDEEYVKWETKIRVENL